MARILIVDDEDSIRRALRLMFERGGHQVIEADSAPRALELVVDSEPPDAIVSDVKMPGMDGMEFYKALGGVAPALQSRLVFLTGASRDPAVHTRIEQLGVPLLGKLDDLQLVVDAIRIALFKRPRP
ncbi:MAG: response regulator [Gemmatimonadales bacterium]